MNITSGQNQELQINMVSALKNHPFAVEAHFEHSIILTFAAPREQLQSLIPECLELDTHNHEWAFIAMAVVQTKSLRPKGFPKILGNDFILVGYRIFVRYTNLAGKRLRGLYILKSETNKKKMELLGNIFTRYRYSTTDIIIKKENDLIAVSSLNSGFNISMDVKNKVLPLPEGSPFVDWKEARRFSGPLPFTFTHDSSDNSVLTIEGVRSNWTPTPIKINQWHISFIENLRLEKLVLANAFIVSDVPYSWKKGKSEKLK
jgi:hypothetical protein